MNGKETINTLDTRESLTYRPKVSVVIPVYNAEKYIAACLDSIFEQDYDNFEVILSYDLKSTDNTLPILEEYSARYSNLHIDLAYDKSSGDARNRGFFLSTGDFLVFIDADDVLVPSYLSHMTYILLAHPELNVVCCKVTSSKDKKIQNTLDSLRNSPLSYQILSNQSAFLGKLWGVKGLFRLPDSAWAWMSRRSFLIEKGIDFPAYSYGEDALFTYKLVLHSKDIGVCENVLYIYRDNTFDSASSRRPKHYWSLYETSFQDRVGVIKQTHPEYLPYFYQYWNYLYVRYLCNFEYRYYRAMIKNDSIISIDTLSYNIPYYVKIWTLIFSNSKLLGYLSVKIATHLRRYIV